MNIYFLTYIDTCKKECKNGLQYETILFDILKLTNNVSINVSRTAFTTKLKIFLA